MHKRSYSRMALEDHLLRRMPITRIEAMTLYGVQDITATIGRIRKEGFNIERQRITLEQAIQRLQKTLKFAPLDTLPVRDIRVMEYRLAK